MATPGTLTAPDPYKVWKALPQKHRRQASWLMSVGVNNAIRQLGAANVYHGYTVNIPEGWADQLFSKAVYESPYMPDTTTFTTTAEGAAIVGNFNNMVIARNGGMSVELVPMLFQQQHGGHGRGFSHSPKRLVRLRKDRLRRRRRWLVQAPRPGRYLTDRLAGPGNVTSLAPARTPP